MPEFCKKCGAAFIQVGADKDGAITAPSCECWLEDAYAESKRQEDHYSFDYFDDYYFDTPPEINQNLDIQQQDFEEIPVPQFAQLKSKYENYVLKINSDQRLKIHEILRLLQEGSEIDDNSSSWLKQEKHFELAGYVHYHNYLKNNNYYEIAMACKCYKHAKLPGICIAITNHLSPISDKNRMCAVLTARGAAFRASARLGLALECAIEALKYDFLDYRPHSLLSAIYKNGKNHIAKIHHGIVMLLRPSNANQNDIESSLKILEQQFRKEYDVSISNWEKALCSWAQQYIPNV